MAKKIDLVNRIQENLGALLTKKEIGEVLSVLPFAIKEIVEEEGSFNYTNFAKFELVDREEKEFRNPGTGVSFIKPACKIFKIKKSKQLFTNIED